VSDYSPGTITGEVVEIDHDKAAEREDMEAEAEAFCAEPPIVPHDEPEVAARKVKAKRAKTAPKKCDPEYSIEGQLPKRGTLLQPPRRSPGYMRPSTNGKAAVAGC